MWAHDLLGIGTDADERAVKRAYAALLKKTRPDEDPAGFQRLVEARDQALWWARNGFVEDDEDEEGPAAAGEIAAPGSDGEAAAADPAVEPAVPAPHPADPATSGPATMADYLRFGLGTEASEAEIRAAFLSAVAELGGTVDGATLQDLIARRDRILRLARPAETGRVDAGLVETTAERAPAGLQPAEPEVPPEPSAGGMVVSRRDAAPLAAGSEDGTNGDAASGRVDDLDDLFEDLLARLDGLSGPAGIRDEAGWGDLLDRAEELDIARRLAFETRVAAALDRALADAAPSDPDQVAALAQAEAAFGWSRDVRRLARLIGDEAAGRPLVAAVERLGGPAEAARRTEDGFPLIEPFDLDAFTEGRGRRLVTYYESARRERAFPASWSWLAALLPGVWFGRHGFGAAVALIAVALAVLLAGYFGQFETARAARDFTSFVFVLTAFRLALATQTHRLDVLRLARLVEEADRKAPGRNERRRGFLQKRRGGSRWTAGFVGALFVLLVDAPVVATFWSAIALDPQAAASHAAPGQSGSLFERMRVHSFLEDREQTLRAIDAAVAAALVDAAPADKVRLADLRTRAHAELEAAGIADYWRLARVWRERAASLRRPAAK